MTPFANETEAEQLGGLTVENRVDRVAIFGETDITKDRAGLGRARQLQTLLNAVVSLLEADGQLPDRIDAPPPTDKVDNPFT